MPKAKKLLPILSEHYIAQNYLFTFKSNKTHVDHQAMAYVAPKRIVNEPNGNENKAANSNGTTNGVNGPAKTAKKFPKWGGAEICPRCDRSVRYYFTFSYHKD